MMLSTESTPIPLKQEGPTPVLLLTERAITRVKDFSLKASDGNKKLFRVYVEGGGCSGYQYGFAMDEKKEDDLQLSFGEVTVLVDPQSRLYLHGSTLDYVDDLKGSGFTVQNPNSKGSCGCGVSFTV